MAEDKIWESWVRDWELHYSLPSKHVPLVSQVPPRWYGGSLVVVHTSTFMLQLKNHELRKPSNYAVSTTARPLLLQGTLINYTWQYATLPSDPKGRLSLSSKAIGYTGILGKIVQNKKTNRTCRNMIGPRKIISWQIHRGAILNSLSVDQSSIPRESPDQKFGILSAAPAQLFFHV